MNTNTKISLKTKSALAVIYKPNGKAGEYGEYAINIATHCPHNCIYCYAPKVLKKDKNEFHSKWEPRKDIVEKVKKDLENFEEKGKHIFLCFTTDPFPVGANYTVTGEIIRLIHDSGNHVQILTKNQLGFESLVYLNHNDIAGITISCDDELAKTIEPNAATPRARLVGLKLAKETVKCKTFVSCEPVYEPKTIYSLISHCDFIDEYKIGKLNYAPSDIDWGEFGRECERLCREHGRKYYIKESLRKEML